VSVTLRRERCLIMSSDHRSLTGTPTTREQIITAFSQYAVSSQSGSRVYSEKKGEAEERKRQGKKGEGRKEINLSRKRHR